MTSGGAGREVSARWMRSQPSAVAFSLHRSQQAGWRHPGSRRRAAPDSSYRSAESVCFEMASTNASVIGSARKRVSTESVPISVRNCRRTWSWSRLRRRTTCSLLKARPGLTRARDRRCDRVARSLAYRRRRRRVQASSTTPLRMSERAASAAHRPEPPPVSGTVTFAATTCASLDAADELPL